MSASGPLVLLGSTKAYAKCSVFDIIRAHPINTQYFMGCLH